MAARIYPVRIGSISITCDAARASAYAHIEDKKTSSYERDSIIKACAATLNPSDDDNLLRIDQNLYDTYIRRDDFIGITLYDVIPIADSEIGYCWRIDKRICIKQSNRR